MCCCRHDLQFPVALREVPGAPWALFGSGDPLLLSRLHADSAVAIVGSRRASSYGREVARTLSRDLAQAGLTVISGLAFGIDACAHRGALEVGITVAVLGCGVDLCHPAPRLPNGGRHLFLATQCMESIAAQHDAHAIPDGLGQRTRWAIHWANGPFVGPNVAKSSRTLPNRCMPESPDGISCLSIESELPER